MNPYQRIPGVQNGSIDTLKKFEQMVAGIELKGLSVLDIGCNLGEMSRLMAAAGAKVHGIDERRDYIVDARRLTKEKNPTFGVQNGYQATGEYDLAILSACFHYFQDPRRLLAQLARVVKRVRVDVWVYEGLFTGMYLSSRGLLIPSDSLFMEMAGRHYAEGASLGKVASPDHSTRLLFDLQKPTPIPPKSMLIYGDGGVGKTTMAKELQAVGFQHLQLDAVFVEWNIGMTRQGWSVMTNTQMLRGELWEKYLGHARNYVRRWLNARRGLDVVVEGWQATDENYKAMVLEELNQAGWLATEEVAL